MTAPSRRSHRGSALRRRGALLRAAIEVVADSGPAAATHRAIAGRAGLPASTPSYFFDSIDELLAEATRHFATEQAAAYDALAAELDDVPVAQFAARFAAAILGADRTVEIAQVEAYLHAARDPALRDATVAVREAFTRTAVRALTIVGVDDPVATAEVVVAYVDGFLLHHLADPRPDDEERLCRGLTALVRVPAGVSGPTLP